MENTNVVAAFNFNFNSGAKTNRSPVRCPPPFKKRFKSTETKTRQSIPVEIMEEVLSHPGVSALKTAHHFCPNRNSATAAHKLSYTIRGDPRSLNALNSSVPLKHIEIKNSTTTKYPNWNFPLSLKTSLTSLTISECTISWPWLVRVVQQFESLETLTLRMCSLERKRKCLFGRGQLQDKRVHSTTTVPEMVHGTVPYMKHPLTIKLEMGSYAVTNSFLKLLTASTPFNKAALEVSISEINAESSLSGSFAFCDQIEFSKLISASNSSEARSVRVTANLMIGNVSLDCRKITEEDGYILVQMYKKFGYTH